MSACERLEPLLHGYRDGELGLLDRWRVQRHVVGCAGCGGELARIGAVSDWVRAAAGAQAEPDLWPAIAAALPAADARRRAAASETQAAGWRQRLWVPLGAATATALAAALAALVWLQPGPPSGGVVRSLYSPGQSVVVLERADHVTIIWVMDPGPEDRAQGGPRGVA